MRRNLLGRAGWFSAILCFLLLVTTVVPFGIGTAHAAGGLTFIGIPDNTSPSNPYIHYSSEITIQGTYPVDVNGEDLRYEVTSLSGNQPNDTSSDRPEIDASTRTFIFRNIELFPGVNKISFSYRNDNANTDLATIYVQYNNTPIFSDLRVENVYLESDPTVVEVSTRSLNVELSGKAVNATNVTVTNRTTGEKFSDRTDSSGRFSIEMDVVLGLNQLDITAYSRNKEVGLVNRSIIVTSSSNVEGRGDQFYNVKLEENTSSTPKPVTSLTKVPPARNELIQTENGKDFTITGELLLKVQSGSTILDGNIQDTTAPAAPADLAASAEVVGGKVQTIVTGVAEAQSEITVATSTKTYPSKSVDDDGNFQVVIDADLTGEELIVTAVDAAKNASPTAKVTVQDKVAPDKPTDLSASINGSSVVVTGYAEKDSTVSVKVGSRSLGSAVAVAGGASPQGMFTITIPLGNAPEGTNLSVIATDSSGNTSAAEVVTVPGTDATAPEPPDVNPIDSDDTTLTGYAEAGTTVTVTGGGVSASATANADGSFTVNLGTTLPVNTVLTVTASDSVGSSAQTTVTVQLAPPTSSDTTPPDVDLDTTTITVADNVITGETEAYATVYVKKGSVVLGQATANGDEVSPGIREFSVPVSSAVAGDKLTVYAVDQAGNVSTAKVVEVKGDNTLSLLLNDDPLAAVFIPVTNSGLSSQYKLYKVSGTIPNSVLQHDKTYELTVTYKTQKQNSGSTTNVINTVTVENYAYLFVYKSDSAPRFGKVTNVSTSNVSIPIRTDGSVNVVNVLPAKLEIEAINMTIAAANFDVYVNNTLKQEGAGKDYVFKPGSAANTIVLEFPKLPANETTVKVVYKYTDPATSENKEEAISFVLKQEVAPSLLFYYTASGQTKVIDGTLEITDSNVSNFVMDGNRFEGKLYNYNLADTDGMEITLNGEGITYSIADKDPNDNAVDFFINKNQFVDTNNKWKFNQGTNTLVFTLKNDPSVKFTYTILYNTERTPKIEDVTLKVIQGKNDEVELKKTSSDAAYSTSAYFLSELSFDVKDVEAGAIVTVKKDGNVIAAYRLQNSSGDWKFLSNDSDYVKSRDAAIKGNTSDLGQIFDETNFSKSKDIKGKFSFSAEMSAKQYGRELLGELEDMGLTREDLEKRLKLFPLTLAKGGSTSYQIEVTQGSVVARHTITIKQETQAWTVLSPTKPENAEYITVNSNSVPIRIFAENATKVLFGKTEAVAYNTTEPDFEYDSDTGKLVPETYYVFETTVSLKAGLNTIKFTVEFGSNKYNDEIKIYNLNSSVGGAEYRDTLGKKTSFSVFDKSFELKFPSGTVLLAPNGERAGSEVHTPSRDIFTDVPLYFGIADRTNGRVVLDDDNLRDKMESVLGGISSRDFNYASPLYYVDAGNAPPADEDEDEERAPGGRDPYFDGTVNDVRMKPFVKRWKYNLVPSKQGTVTIKYDSSIVNAANNVLTVFYNNGDEWFNLGGVVNTSKQTITVPFEGFGYYMVMMTRETFSDVIHHPFARDAIETLYAKGIMKEAPGEGFGTERKIRRGEFATMLVKALDLPINAGPYNSRGEPTAPTFRDVHPSTDDWDYEYEYIETAARAGIVRGKSVGRFAPDEYLTREEAAVMIARALNLKLGTPEAADKSLGKMFTDAQLTGYYAKPSVLAVAKAKIMTGEPNNANAQKPTYRFNPKGDLTRAEMAVITIRIMQQLKKLPKS